MSFAAPCPATQCQVLISRKPHTLIVSLVRTRAAIVVFAWKDQLGGARLLRIGDGAG